MSSSPAGSSSANPAATRGASAYIPAAQQSADALFQRLLDPANVGSLGDVAVNPQNSPAGLAYTQGQPLVNNVVSNPGFPFALTGAQDVTNLSDLAYSLAGIAPGQTWNAANTLFNQAPSFQGDLLGYGHDVAAMAPGVSSTLGGYGNNVAQMAPAENQVLQGLSTQLSGLTPSIISQAFDPQGALRAYEEDRLRQQTATQNAFSGVGGTPYGADIANEAMGNFGINWENNQLQRMLQGANAAQGLTTAAGQLSDLGARDYGSLYQTAGGLANQGALGAGSLYGTAGNLVQGGAGDLTSMLTAGGNLLGSAQNQYGTGIGNVLSGSSAQSNLYDTRGTQGLNALSSLANIGNNQYLLPQQVLNDLQSYLGLGQSASQLSGQLGQMGLNQLGQAAGGIGSLLGSGLGLGSPSNPGYLASGIGSLFGGGAAAALPAADYFAPTAGVLGGIADFGGGADLLPLLALGA